MVEFSPLFTRPHGLVVMCGAVRQQPRPLWEAMSDFESLYFIGPLAEKPVLGGPARVWLLECPLGERTNGVRHVLRLDAHGIVVIGPADRDLVELAVKAALGGSFVVLDVGADSVTNALEVLRSVQLDPRLLASALVGVASDEGAWLISEAGRERLAAGAPSAEVLIA